MKHPARTYANYLGAVMYVLSSADMLGAVFTSAPSSLTPEDLGFAPETATQQESYDDWLLCRAGGKEETTTLYEIANEGVMGHVLVTYTPAGEPVRFIAIPF